MLHLSEEKFHTSRRLAVYSYLIQKRVKKLLSGKREVPNTHYEDDYDSHIVDDMPLTLSRDAFPGRRSQGADSLSY